MDRFKLSRQVKYLIKRAQHDLRRDMDDNLRPLGLTTPQYVAMHALADFPGISNADIARKCFVTPQTMNVIIVGLEKGGSIERASHETHGRIQKITLSDAGEALLAKADELIHQIEKKTFKVFTLEELGQLSKLLEKLTNREDSIRDREDP